MKLILPLLVLVFLTVLSCTEEIIVPGEIVHDTIYVNKTNQQIIDRVVVRVDSIFIPGDSIPYPVPGKDSIIYVPVLGPIRYRVDTVYKVTTIIDRDTVVVREYAHSDTMYIFVGHPTYHQLPPELDPMVDEFFAEARRKGYLPPGGYLYVVIAKFDDVLPAYSNDDYGQINIFLNGNQTTDEMFIPLWRELARQELHKEYSLDTNNPMYLFYPSHKIRWSNRSQYKTEIDKIFK